MKTFFCFYIESLKPINKSVTVRFVLMNLILNGQFWNTLISMTIFIALNEFGHEFIYKLSILRDQLASFSNNFLITENKLEAAFWVRDLINYKIIEIWAGKPLSVSFRKEISY